MALARLITRTPECAQQLAQSLANAGYAVEFAAPEEVSSTHADLEVNLDDPSAASSYIVTADGGEISFTYDPVEREFVLAPWWRKLMSALEPVMERFDRQPANSAVAAPSAPPADPVVVPEPVAVAPVVMESAVEDPPHEPLPEPVVVESLYLPPTGPVAEPAEEPLHFSGVDYFDGLGERRTKSASEPTAPEPEVVAEAPEPVAPRVQSTPWLVQAGVRAQVLREVLKLRWAAVRMKISSLRLREYDRAWLRAVPTAAIITLAFLLGWGFANSGDSNPQPSAASTAVPEVKEAAIVPAPAAKPVPMKATTTKPEAKPTTQATGRDEGEDEEAPDVVIRHYPKHYPSKGVQAADQKSVRRYSDMED